MKAPTSIEYGKLMKLRLGIGGDTYEDYFKNRDNYDNLLSQKPELWQFVPCDKDGKPMEKPFNYDLWVKRALNTYYDADLSKYEAYQTALSKVVFKGWEVVINDEELIRLRFGDMYLNKYSDSEYFSLRVPYKNTIEIHTLESLIPFGVELTDEKAKEFKLI